MGCFGNDNGEIKRQPPSLRCFIALLAAGFLFALPRIAYSQKVEPDTATVSEQQQDETDDPLLHIGLHKHDSVKAEEYYEKAYHSDVVDTILKYATLSLEYCNTTDSGLLSSDLHELGYVYYMEDEAREALKYSFMAINVYNEGAENEHVAQAYLGVGLCYEDLNITDSIFYYFNKALNIYIKLQDTAKVSKTYKYIGEVYKNMNLYVNAEENYRKALSYAILSNDTLEMAVYYRCIGKLFSKKSDTLMNEAISYIKKSILLFESKDTDIEDYIAEKHFAYTDLARAYIKMAKSTGKKVYADSCFIYNRKVGNYYLNKGEILNHITGRYTYIEYLVFYQRYSEALKGLLRLGEYFDDDSPIVDLENYHKHLYEVYLALGDYKNALDNYVKYDEYKSEQVNENTINTVKNAEVERTRMLEELKRENAEKLHAAERQRMRIVNISLIGGLSLFLLLIFYIAKMLHIKHKANAELTEKNAILAEQAEEIQAQNDEIMEQNEEIQAQNEAIMTQNEEIQAQAETIKKQSEEIHDSINYARRIQRSLLTPSATINRIFPDHFVLYKPRNIVSGDYYWVGQFGDNKVSVVADCTGHGVPGGFLSVLGMANLNYIVRQDVTPDTILNHLREAIITNLRQRATDHTALHDREHPTSQVDTNDRSRDGMDVAVYVVNEKLMKLSYAGANNPLVLIRNNEVQVFKADRMPVGIYTHLEPFQCTTIDIQHGDCIYTFSDGFQDQFGIETNKKFMGRRLRELLLEIHRQPMAEQKKILNVVYEEWRGPASNQTDDVVVMGVRI